LCQLVKKTRSQRGLHFFLGPAQCTMPLTYFYWCAKINYKITAIDNYMKLDYDLLSEILLLFLIREP
jgi:hypothetical protein